MPTEGPWERVYLQVGNSRPRSEIATGTGPPLNNRIGDVFPLDWHPDPCPDAEGDWSYTHVVDLGLTWARISLYPMEWSPTFGAADFSSSQVNRCQEEIVDLLAARGVTMVMTIVFWDPELHATRPPDYGNEEEVERYLDQARMVVAHFKDRIRYYEILNEAIAYVELPDYLNLVRRTIPVIRGEYPDARIMVDGASSPFFDQNRAYLFGVLGSDVMPMVDAIALHPLYGASPAYEDTRDYYTQYPALLEAIRVKATANGFAGQIVSEEMVWRTSYNPNPGEPWVYSPVVAAKYYARAIVLHLGMDVWAGIGGESYDAIQPIARSVRNLAWVMAGAEPAPLNVTVQSPGISLKTYEFTLPGDERLVAIWTDGAAVDDDPGVTATLTIHATSASSAVGIDPLNGFQQELAVRRSGPELTVSDLLVPDYPIFILLAE